MSLKVTLDMIVFTEEVDAKIISIWEEMKAIHEFHDDRFL